MPDPKISSSSPNARDSVRVELVEFLSYLRSLDINVFVEGDRLRCNAPEGIITPELRAEISQKKAEIVSFLKVANRTSSFTPTPIVPMGRDGNLPLSFAQQRLWFLDQLVPNNPFYNVPAALRLTGSLNFSALQQTFNEIVRRHEALRTTLAVVSGQPVQRIAPPAIPAVRPGSRPCSPPLPPTAGTKAACSTVTSCSTRLAWSPRPPAIRTVRSCGPPPGGRWPPTTDASSPPVSAGCAAS